MRFDGTKTPIARSATYLAAFGLLASLLVVGCRQRHAGSVTLAQAVAAERALLCEATCRCCEPNIARHLAEVDDPRLCGQPSGNEPALLAELEAGVNQGQLTYDESAAKRCLAETRRKLGETGACDRRFEGGACSLMVIGTVAEGGRCRLDTAVPWCGSGMYCKPTSAADGICVKVASAGQSCTGRAGAQSLRTSERAAQSACARGLRCADGKCVHLLADGEPCKDSDECESAFCIGGGPSRCAPYTLRRATCTE